MNVTNVSFFVYSICYKKINKKNHILSMGPPLSRFFILYNSGMYTTMGGLKIKSGIGLTILEARHLSLCYPHLMQATNQYIHAYPQANIPHLIGPIVAVLPVSKAVLQRGHIRHVPRDPQQIMGPGAFSTLELR